jgi:hypothetical protein
MPRPENVSEFLVRDTSSTPYNHFVKGVSQQFRRRLSAARPAANWIRSSFCWVMSLSRPRSGTSGAHEASMRGERPPGDRARGQASSFARPLGTDFKDLAALKNVSCTRSRASSAWPRVVGLGGRVDPHACRTRRPAVRPDRRTLPRTAKWPRVVCSYPHRRSTT